MGTFRMGKWITWDGCEYYAIEKKTLFGWKVFNTWIVSLNHGFYEVQEDKVAKKKMNEAVDRLVKVGHTVI